MKRRGMIKLFYLLLGLLFIYNGIMVITTKKYDIKHGTYLELGDYSLIIGTIIILLGIYLIYLWKTYVKKTVYSKCLKCKETYLYLKLEKGICPKCNIKTIDIDEYYKKKEK